MILFLAANPSGTDRLALGREARSIHAELKRSGYRGRFDFVTRWAAEPLDLLRELRELKPTVVHFSGHGRSGRPRAPRSEGARDVVDGPAPSDDEPQGIVFQDATGNPQVVPPEAIAETFRAAGTSVKLVVLNACYTVQIAEALLAQVDYVVGMSGSIHDDAARSFAIGFYGGLGEHESIAAAFEQGRAAINLMGLLDSERPRLQVREGFDATELILAAIPPALRQELPCPYPGMRPFAADDADTFHGRDAEITELISWLRAGEREIYVIGPSGSGKSSLVAAGVLPRLARGVAGAGPFVVCALRPGDQPATRLYRALDVPPGRPFDAASRIVALLAYRAPGSSLLIVVDQLEELFTQASAYEREVFLVALRMLRGDSRCVVIFTLRADFLGALMESPLWVEHRGQLSRVEVSPLHGEALRNAISAPARDKGVVVEPELIERLLADAASEPGILPLLQETMVQLWDERVDQTLTLSDYQALGDGDRSGLAVALARWADATLRRFTPAHTRIARRILLRLISFGEGRSDTRRQQPLSNLRSTSEEVADFSHVLQTMIDHRLLTSDDDEGGGEPRVDLAHEILIGGWPALADWIRSHRMDEQRRRQLEAAATEWAMHSRGPRGLLDSIELADAEAWQQTESARDIGKSEGVREFIQASRTAHDRQRWRVRISIAGAFMIIAVFAAVWHRQANEKQYLLARSYLETGRQLVVEGHAQEAIPYLLAARQNGEDGTPLRMLFWISSRDSPVVPALQHPGRVDHAVFSPDGKRVITASGSIARIWDVVTGEPLGDPLEHNEIVADVAFSPDGTRVVTASYDKSARVWDAATGKPLTDPFQHEFEVMEATFSSDGARVVTTDDNATRVFDSVTGERLAGPFKYHGKVRSATFNVLGTRIVTASDDKTAQVWDTATGELAAPPLPHGGPVVDAVFSSDGTRVVTASDDQTARVWDAATGQPLTGPLKHEKGVAHAEISSDNLHVVTLTNDRSALVWDVITGKQLVALKHPDLVLSATFSFDGKRIVTASYDRTARVWDAITGQQLTDPLEHQGGVVSAAFSPDGTRVITASEDQTARIWNVTIGSQLTSPLEHDGLVWSAAFSPDGRRVVTASGDRTARVWDAAMGKQLTVSLKHYDTVVAATFSPDGTHILTGSWDTTARIWDAATGRQLIGPLVHRDRVNHAAYNPTGTRVITASSDKTARIWDAITGVQLTTLVHQDPVYSAAFSPDGRRVVTVSGNLAQLWDATTGKQLISPLLHRGQVERAAFSPDGTRVATVSGSSAQLWNAATGKLLTASFVHQEKVVSVAFSPDGARLVTASQDRTARVWDAATGTPITGALEHERYLTSAAFSPDGARIVTVSANTVMIWDASTGKPLTEPFLHQGKVPSAVFSPDGTRLVTASWDKTARVWDVRLDEGTLEQWSATAERSPFVLAGSALVRRAPGTELKPAD